MLISSTERIEAKLIFSIGGIVGILVGLLILLFSLIEPLYYIAPFISLSLITLGVHSIRYSKKLSRVELFPNYIQISRNKKTIQVSFDNIKSISYLLLPIKWFTEPAIKIRFVNKTSLGKSVFLSPSNLTKEREFVFNQKIKRLLEDKIEGSKKEQAK